jgi:hypothetical protein
LDRDGESFFFFTFFDETDDLDFEPLFLYTLAELLELEEDLDLDVEYFFDTVDLDVEPLDEPDL